MGRAHFVIAAPLSLLQVGWAGREVPEPILPILCAYTTPGMSRNIQVPASPPCCFLLGLFYIFQLYNLINTYMNK